jgi:hypothetical protein
LKVVKRVMQNVISVSLGIKIDYSPQHTQADLDCGQGLFSNAREGARERGGRAGEGRKGKEGLGAAAGLISAVDFSSRCFIFRNGLPHARARGTEGAGKQDNGK